MSTMNKSLTILLVLVLVFLNFSISRAMQSNETVETLSQELDMLKEIETDIKGYTSELKRMNLEIRTLQIDVKNRKRENEMYLSLVDKVRSGEWTEEQLQKVFTIEEETPLDLQAATALVEHAVNFDLNPSLLLGIMELESNFDPYSVGTHQDRGLMQIIPSTEKWLANDFGEKIGVDYDPEQIFDPYYNIGLAAVYIDFLRDAYGNNYNRILSEYNRGPYNLKAYYAKHRTYETSYSRVILKKEKKYLAFNE